jgi:single-strand DNA-binding protein
MASRSINKAILLGHLGKDAETKFTPSGTAKTSFTLATSRRWKDQQSGEWKEETDWHNVTLWKMENLANYLLKGKQVYVEGRISHRSYDDKDGNKKFFTEIVADEIILLGGRGEGGGPGDDFGQPASMPRSAPRGPQATRPQPQASRDESSFDPGITDDDVPF